MCTDNLNIGINGKLNKTETILLCHMNIKYFLPPPTFFTWPFVRPSVRLLPILRTRYSKTSRPISLILVKIVYEAWKETVNFVITMSKVKVTRCRS